MSSHEVSDVPVIDGATLSGMIREARLMSAVINDRALLAAPVTQIMDAPCPTVDIHNDVQTAIQLLRNAPLVAVTEFGSINGVLTRHDVLEYL
jgi:cystathionine beta-synthase